MGMRPIVTTEVGKGPSQNHSGLKLKIRDRSKEKKNDPWLCRTELILIQRKKIFLVLPYYSDEKKEVDNILFFARIYNFGD